MKCDMDFVRQILLSIEKHQKEYVCWSDLDVDRSSKDLRGHLNLMKEASLVDFRQEMIAIDGYSVDVRLTWEGHKFLDHSRNESVWNRAKSLAIKNSISLSLASLKSVLQTLASNTIPD